MSKKKEKLGNEEDYKQFQAEAAYADSIFKSALGDSEGSVASLEHAFKLMPSYPPAILSMGSVEYQRGRPTEGRKLLLSLLSLPENTEDLCEIIDKAGSFLINIGAYADGLELYRGATARFPDVAVIHQGLGCCAGHEGLHEIAIEASRRAIELEPENQEFVNDLGWSLLQANKLIEAKKTLELAVEMDPSDELAKENLRYCITLMGPIREDPTVV